MAILGFEVQYIYTLIKIILFLPIILFLIYVFAKYGGSSLQKIQKGRYMSVLDRLPLSKDNALLIVKVGEKVYLVASSQGKVEVIEELNYEEVEKIEKTRKIKEYTSVKEFYSKLINKKED
ncbi:flagellar biosynthetic protein FliO [Clostridium tetani]|uniref:Flagellar protein n=1 Tax=Clostridium tetani TaxID=1513 RepID=A0A4Q0VDL4_CLOTA|nr:flagellar biosynthetic protein FliO [Clostridium tetani]RXI49505.1 flagellar biosynthetic protein FliO [Clostridium tetani]